MKKRIKKLNLHRETVRNLGDPEMRTAAGGTRETSALCRDVTFCGCEATQSLCTYGCTTNCN
jgi:hypothetical protein